jgi:hypothetical protein
MVNRLLLVMVAAVFSFPVHAADGRQQEDARTPGTFLEQLSPGLRQLLAEEMVALQDGMQSLLPHIISGQWEEIAGRAGKIRDSHILQQKLTQSQADELHRVLPSAFRETDQEFHHFADMLAHAADNRNRELVTFYYYRMTDACLSCHGKFATHRFPQLKPGGRHAVHHH